MQFLRTAFWVVIAMIIMLFSFTNWTDVIIRIWGGNEIQTKLPVVVIVAFLAGSVPLWLFHKATRWRMNRKLESAERALAATQPPPLPAAQPQIPANSPTTIDTSPTPL